MAVGSIGKYERLDVLGHGTSGVVYLAWDTLLRRHVALKEIRAAGPEMERVLDEARVLDRLGRHPHIVEIHSVDSVDGAVLIDMELIRGGNLADVLRRQVGTPLPAGEAVRIASAVLDALAYAHERRIIHRDIKPANILIGEGGEVKLTDFGLAEALGSGSVAGGGGTYPYMAPEDFAENAESDYRADLWAVGVVVYEMLIGKRPFQVAARTKDPFAWKRAIAEETPPPISSLNPDVPPAFDAVVARALAKSKFDRYVSATNFRDALTVAAGTDTSAADPIASVPDATAAGVTSAPVAANVAPISATTTVPLPSLVLGGVVPSDIDELLRLCAHFWNDARQAMLDGRLETCLRSLGEIYLAELAADLRARTGDPDRRLTEFLKRSQADTEEEIHDDRTLPAEPAANGGGGARLRRGFRLQPRHATPVARGTFPEMGTVIAPTSTAPVTNAGAAWWFWPLYVACLGPLCSALAGGILGRHGAETVLVRALQGWIATGFLSATLLIIALRRRFPLSGRAVCALTVAAGLIAAGALVSRVTASSPTPDALMRVAVLVVLPIGILLIAAASIDRAWRLWAWFTLIAALALSIKFVTR